MFWCLSAGIALSFRWFVQTWSWHRLVLLALLAAWLLLTAGTGRTILPPALSRLHEVRVLNSSATQLLSAVQHAAEPNPSPVLLASPLLAPSLPSGNSAYDSEESGYLFLDDGPIPLGGQPETFEQSLYLLLSGTAGI